MVPPELNAEMVTIRLTESKVQVGELITLVPLRVAQAELRVGVIVVGKVILIIPV